MSRLLIGYTSRLYLANTLHSGTNFLLLDFTMENGYMQIM